MWWGEPVEHSETSGMGRAEGGERKQRAWGVAEDLRGSREGLGLWSGGGSRESGKRSGQGNESRVEEGGGSGGGWGSSGGSSVWGGLEDLVEGLGRGRAEVLGVGSSGGLGDRGESGAGGRRKVWDGGGQRFPGGSNGRCGGSEGHEGLEGRGGMVEGWGGGRWRVRGGGGWRRVRREEGMVGRRSLLPVSTLWWLSCLE